MMCATKLGDSGLEASRTTHGGPCRQEGATAADDTVPSVTLEYLHHPNYRRVGTKIQYFATEDYYTARFA